jgi:hypothetical protein
MHEHLRPRPHLILVPPSSPTHTYMYIRTCCTHLLNFGSSNGTHTHTTTHTQPHTHRHTYTHRHMHSYKHAWTHTCFSHFLRPSERLYTLTLKFRTHNGFHTQISHSQRLIFHTLTNKHSFCTHLLGSFFDSFERCHTLANKHSFCTHLLRLFLG